MAKNIVSLKIDGNSYSARPFGTCDTAAATAAKVVTCADFSLTTGATIIVKFTYANTASSPTLNVNGTGAKAVHYRGAALASSLYYWAAKDVVEFYYDGTQWNLMDVGNTNSTYANYSFGNGYATCETAAATAAKVVTYQYYNMSKGGIVAIKFAYAVPAESTLNINSKGAKSIYHNGAKITAGVIGAGDIATFVYDGANYVLLAVDNIMTAAEKTKLAGIASGATANTGTVTSVATGVGLTGGPITTSGTIKCKLNSETSLGTIGSTSKLYAVGVDVNGKLCVNVPWSDNNTNYYPTTFTWTNGTSSAGPTGSLTGSGMSAVSFGAIPSATTSIYGVTKLSSATNSTSTSLAATASAVKAAYDLAASKASNAFSQITIEDGDYTETVSASGPTGGFTLNAGPNINMIYDAGRIRMSATCSAATDTELGGVNKGYAIPYIVGSSSDAAGVWTGSCDGITSYKDGLTIIYVPQKAGISSGTTLNINGLGAKACYINNYKMTTNFPTNVPILLTYITQSGTGYWKYTDYVDGNAYTSAYCTTGGSTAAKTATLSNYVLTSKTYTFISISNANTVQGAITLNINSKGAKPIYINGNASSASNYTLPAGTYVIYYDGTNYHFRTDGKLPGVSNYSLPTATASTLGGVKIGSNITVSSGTISLTKVNVTNALGYTPPTTNTTYGVATTSAAGLMSTHDAEMFDENGVVCSWNGTTAHQNPSDVVIKLSKFNRIESNSEWSEDTVDYTINSATTTKAGVMSNIDKVKLDNINIGLGECLTAATTAAKVVNMASTGDWIDTVGSIIYVRCSYTNTADNPTLNVNGTGAKPIYYNGSQIRTSNKSYATYAGRLMKFICAGGYYMFAGWDIDNNPTYANYSFGNGYATCATAAATVAKVATYANYSLQTGGIVAVKFTYAVPANSTLNINSKGAKSIYYNGAKITAGIIGAGDIVTFIYDGTNYVLLAVDSAFRTATTSKKGLMSAVDKEKLNNLNAPYPNGEAGDSFSIIVDFDNGNGQYIVNLDEQADMGYLYNRGLYLLEANECSDIDGDSHCVMLFVYKPLSDGGSLVLSQKNGGGATMTLSLTNNNIQFNNSDGTGEFTLREINTNLMYI